MRHLFNRKQKFIQDAGEYHYSETVISDLENYYLWRTKHCNDWDEAIEKLEPRELNQLLELVDSIDNMPPQDVLSIYLEWNGIIGYDEQIIDHYENGDLEDYLNEEGIIGYTSDIKSILDQDKSLVLAHNNNYAVEKIGRRYNILNKENKAVSVSTNKKEALSNFKRLSNNQPVRGVESPHSVYTWDVADRYGHVIRNDTPYPNITEARNAAKAAAMDTESIKGIYTVYIYIDGLFLEKHTFDK